VRAASQPKPSTPRNWLIGAIEAGVIVVALTGPYVLAPERNSQGHESKAIS
jgi:hypothetical protein